MKQNRLSVALLFGVLCASILPGLACAAEKLRLEIVQPFIEFRTGPGKPYPVFYVAQRGEQIEIQKRRNDWYKVTLQVNQNHQKVGWIHRDAVGETVVASSMIGNTIDQSASKDSATGALEPVMASEHPRLRNAFNPRVYLGFTYGQSSTADIAGLYTGYAITRKLAVELQANEILGQSFQSTSVSGNFSLTPFDNWRIAPFFQVGAGAIDNKARVTTSQQNDASDKFFQSTAGFGVLFSKRYRLRFEYRHMNILQSRDDNREIETWQLGFIGYL